MPIVHFVFTVKDWYKTMYTVIASITFYSFFSLHVRVFDFLDFQITYRFFFFFKEKNNRRYWIGSHCLICTYKYVFSIYYHV